MSGYDFSRFVDLRPSLAQHLKCSICLGVWKTPMDTKCKHTFCDQCIHRTLAVKNECPICRQVVGTRGGTRAQSALQLERNIVALNIINGLEYKCYTEFNGCQMPVQLGLMDSHLQECDQYLCEKCGYKMGKTEEHNCLENLKNALNECRNANKDMENQLNESQKSLQMSANANKDIERELNECKRKLKDSENKCLDSEKQIKRLKTENDIRSGQQWVNVREETQLNDMECFEELTPSPKRVQIDYKSFIRLRLMLKSYGFWMYLMTVGMKPNSKFSTLLALLKQKSEYGEHKITIKDKFGTVISICKTPKELGLQSNDIIEICLK